MKKWRILTIGTGENSRIVANAISHWAVETVCCSTLEEARRLLPDAGISLIFCEDEFKDGTYRDLLYALSRPSKNRVVVISSVPELEEKYDEAKGLGVFDMIPSPCRRSDVQWVIVHAIHQKAPGGNDKRRYASGERSLQDSNPDRRNHNASINI